MLRLLELKGGLLYMMMIHQIEKEYKIYGINYN